MSWVIKIGGSLYNSQYLIEWLHVLAKCDAHNIIIVPGGGPFADQVRLADERYRLNQVTAHNMAVLGMQQFGYLMAALCPGLALANTRERIHAYWQQSKVVIWEPFEMLRGEFWLEKSWQVTSDSLAAWLANHLSIRNLLLVKSSDIIKLQGSIDELAKNGYIDSTFPELVADMNISVQCMHKSRAKDFQDGLCDK